MSIFSYLKVHAHCEQVASHRPINKTKFSKSPESHYLKEIAKATTLDKSLQCVTKKERTGVGFFHRVTVNSGKAECNCENYRRYGLCFHVEFFNTVCLLTVPPPEMQSWSKTDGINVIRKKLINLLSPYVLSRNDYFDDYVTDTSPPVCDPMVVLSPFKHACSIDS